MQHAFLSDQVVSSLFLDLKAAFDKVHHTPLKIKLNPITGGGRGANASAMKLGDFSLPFIGRIASKF